MLFSNQNDGKEYPVYLQGKLYKKLLVIQTKPEVRCWYKDREVSIEELTSLLENTSVRRPTRKEETLAVIAACAGIIAGILIGYFLS